MGTVSHAGRRAQDPMSPARSFARQAKSTLLRLGLFGALALLPAASVPLTASAAVAPATMADVSTSVPCSAVPLPC